MNDKFKKINLNNYKNHQKHIATEVLNKPQKIQLLNVDKRDINLTQIYHEPPVQLFSNRIKEKILSKIDNNETASFRKVNLSNISRNNTKNIFSSYINRSSTINVKRTQENDSSLVKNQSITPKNNYSQNIKVKLKNDTSMISKQVNNSYLTNHTNNTISRNVLANNQEINKSYTSNYLLSKNENSHNNLSNQPQSTRKNSKSNLPLQMAIQKETSQEKYLVKSKSMDKKTLLSNNQLLNRQYSQVNIDKLNNIHSSTNQHSSSNSSQTPEKYKYSIKKINLLEKDPIRKHVVCQNFTPPKKHFIKDNSPTTVSSLLHNQNKQSLSLSNINCNFQGYEDTKHANKSNPPLYSYAANTYQGIIRNYNEDRVSIILNISKPSGYVGHWPKCSIFGVFDGHGGNICADFLRDNLHSYIIKDQAFPHNPDLAIKRGFTLAERDFLYKVAFNKKTNEINDKSGSCALLTLIIENTCYVANVGDSRAILSKFNGREVHPITKDHKPNDEDESKRIIANGGKIYQTQTQTKLFNPNTNQYVNQIILGPHRVFPGRLSVSKTFGDIEAKEPILEGMVGVVTAEPDIFSFKIDSNCDFLILGCDGIFDQLENEEIINAVWHSCSKDNISNSIHSQSAIAVDLIMKSSLVRKTFDNITLVFIAFEGFDRLFSTSISNQVETNKPVIMEKEVVSGRYNIQGIQLLKPISTKNSMAKNFLMKTNPSRQPTQLLQSNTIH